MKNRGRFRLLFVVLGGLLCAGLVAFSALGVRYSVQGAEKSELFIIERSLTHSIERGPDGRLTMPSVSRDGSGTVEGKPGKQQPKPCPT